MFVNITYNFNIIFSFFFVNFYLFILVYRYLPFVWMSVLSMYHGLLWKAKRA